MSIVINRLRRFLKKALFGTALVWFPAVLVVLVFGSLMVVVATSKDGSFNTCSRILIECRSAENSPSLPKLGICALQTAWCDIGVLYDKATGQFVPEIALVPKISDAEFDENQAKMRDYLISDEVIESRTEEHEKELKNEQQENALTAEQLKEQMKQMRFEREAFEREQNTLREEYHKKALDHSPK